MYWILIYCQIYVMSLGGPHFQIRDGISLKKGKGLRKGNIKRPSTTFVCTKYLSESDIVVRMASFLSGLKINMGRQYFYLYQYRVLVFVGLPLI